MGMHSSFQLCPLVPSLPAAGLSKAGFPECGALRGRMELRNRSLFQSEVVIRILPGGTSTAVLLFLYHTCNTQISDVFGAS